jgi:hypothetical protein
MGDHKLAYDYKLQITNYKLQILYFLVIFNLKVGSKSMENTLNSEKKPEKLTHLH